MRRDRSPPAIAVAVAYVLRFDMDAGTPTVFGDFSPSYVVVSVALVGLWFLALAAAHSWDRRLLGNGSGEYSAVFGATWRLFAIVAIVALVIIVALIWNRRLIAEDKERGLRIGVGLGPGKSDQSGDGIHNVESPTNGSQATPEREEKLAMARPVARDPIAQGANEKRGKRNTKKPEKLGAQAPARFMDIRTE